MTTLPLRFRQASCWIAAAVLSFVAVFSGEAKSADGDKSSAARPQIVVEGPFANLAGRLQQEVDDGIVSGAVTAVALPDRIAIGTVGMADVESRRPMRPDSMFAIASMTKPITAVAVMILVDEGKLSLDDPVSKYIPEFKAAKLKDGSQPKREVAVRDLLTHQSLAGDQRLEGTLAESARKLAARPLEAQPGEKWIYGPGLTAAGRVVEVASGRPYSEFVAERIFRPLGMKDTTFDPTPEQVQRLVTLYEPRSKEKPLRPVDHWIRDFSDPIRSPNPSGGLFSTAEDICRFHLAMLDGSGEGNHLLSAASRAEMVRVQTGQQETGLGPGTGWGLGWCVVRRPQAASAMLSAGSFGHAGAFGTQAWVDPQRPAVYVMLIQGLNLPADAGGRMRTGFQQAAADLLTKEH